MVQSGELSIVDLDAARCAEPLIVKVGLGWAVPPIAFLNVTKK